MTLASASHTLGLEGSLFAAASRHARALATVSGLVLAAKPRRTQPQAVFSMSPAVERRARSASSIASAQQARRVPGYFSLIGRGGAFEDRRNRLRPHARAGMNVIDLERHPQRVAARFQVPGDDIVGVQLPACFDRVCPARGAPRAADDTPDGLVAGGVPRLLTDALGELVVLRISGHVGERQDRDRRHAEARRRRRFRRRDGRRGFARR